MIQKFNYTRDLSKFKVDESSAGVIGCKMLRSQVLLELKGLKNLRFWWLTVMLDF